MTEKMSENKTQEGWYDEIRDANKKVIKELAALMNKVADNPRVGDEELEQIVGTLRANSLPHRLDTAADGCNG
jgi:hypothetical protein